MAHDDNVPITEVAARMRKPPQFVRIGLQQGRLPFGVAVKGSKRWSYYVNRRRFERYMAGEDMGGAHDDPQAG